VAADECLGLRDEVSSLPYHFTSTHPEIGGGGGWGGGREELTPPGIKRPSTVSPPGGTTLGVPNGIGGTSRMISLMTAVKYGMLLAASELISLELLNRPRTSCFSFSYTGGVLHSQYVKALIAVAVVSLPAMMRVLL